jgi:hypothetical protein
MLFIIHNWEGFAAASAICLGSFAAIWFFWFRHQPKGNFHE